MHSLDAFVQCYLKMFVEMSVVWMTDAFAGVVATCWVADLVEYGLVFLVAVVQVQAVEVPRHLDYLLWENDLVCEVRQSWWPLWWSFGKEQERDQFVLQ